MLKTLTLIIAFSTASIFADQRVNHALEQYKHYLIEANAQKDSEKYFSPTPKPRYYTFKKAFNLFAKANGKVIVELGATRSFVDGNYKGCLSSDLKYWEPTNPDKWDWGAGIFTLMAAKCLHHLHPTIHTVDLSPDHIFRSKVITEEYKNIMHYYVSTSEKFLKSCKPRSIDLLYSDTGDFPIEDTARLHLREAKLIVKKDLIAPGGLILIDDVKSTAPMRIENSQSRLGKAKYEIPYLLKHGFEIIMDEYQVLLRKKS